MDAGLPVGWWTFWMSAGFAVYVALVWVLVRLARASDDASAAPERQPPTT